MKRKTSWLWLVFLLALLGLICWLRLEMSLDRLSSEETSSVTETTLPSEEDLPGEDAGLVSAPVPTPAPTPTPVPTPTPYVGSWNATPPPAATPTSVYTALTEEQYTQDFGSDSETVEDYTVEISESDYVEIN